MSLLQLHNVTFGVSKANLTGSTGVGFTILSTVGAIVQSRTTAGVYQLISGSGIYAAYISFSDGFHGQVLWDTGETPPIYAAEQYNYEANNPKVDQIHIDTQFVTGALGAATSSIAFIRDMTEGRWQIVSDQMVFFKADNVTEVARFNLLDIDGIPTTTAPSQRVKV